MKPKNGSYPYLRISKQLGLDYGDVLLTNEFLADVEAERTESSRVCAREAHARVVNTLSTEAMLDLQAKLKYQRDEFAIIRKEGWD